MLLEVVTLIKGNNMDLPIHVTKELQKVTEQELIDYIKGKFPKSKICLKTGFLGTPHTLHCTYIEVDDEYYIGGTSFYNLVRAVFFNF